MSPSPTSAGAAPKLWLLSLQPDMGLLGRWVGGTRQRALDDPGYALHAALRATLGVHAPKPFALLQRPMSTQLVGYCGPDEAGLRRAIDLATISDLGAAHALGLGRPEGATLRAMPADWRSGETLSFESRVAPVVRSRQQPGGGYPEIDAAYHPDFCGDAPGDRAAAHANWLRRELARAGAATLLSHRPLAFTLADIARRTQAAEGGSVRATRGGLLPDLTVRGQLRIDDPQAFQALLARGLGRHRSFGFGCLLVAPAGAWT